MREIKFRAKDITDNWCYGQLIIGNNYDFIITESDYDEVVATLSTLVCQCHPIKKGSDTIGQFTGLLDKNGKEIYEGDIVKSTYREVRDYSGIQYKNKFEFIEKVVWSKDYNGWCLQIEDDGIELYRRFNFCEEVNKIKLDSVEVIGNIFDNPELLEGEKDE